MSARAGLVIAVGTETGTTQEVAEDLGRGERGSAHSEQLLCKLGDTESISILPVNVSAFDRYPAR